MVPLVIRISTSPTSSISLVEMRTVLGVAALSKGYDVPVGTLPGQHVTEHTSKTQHTFAGCSQFPANACRLDVG